MRVHITYTVDVDDRIRRAINRYYGRRGLASRGEVKRWYEQYGGSMDADLDHYYGDDCVATEEG